MAYSFTKFKLNFIPPLDPGFQPAVTLKGANSFDIDGTITSYVWKEGAAQITTGATAAVNLPFGTHAISLVVTDNGGATGTNTVMVNVTL